jgi:hypothetical protein
MPPLDPAQLQVQGPLPLTVEAVPAEQSPLVGAALASTPFAAPHTPAPDAFWTLRLKETVAEVPPDCPAGVENASTLIEFVPFANWAVLTDSA